ncbi:MAG: hypothetical protein HY331_14380 [Chloroflexi bacterium]|nr:hypothetical protein [Chloroflexota bacterium]
MPASDRIAPEMPAAEQPIELTCLACLYYRPVPEDHQPFVEFAGVCLAPAIPISGPFRTRTIVEPTAPCPGFE